MTDRSLRSVAPLPGRVLSNGRIVSLVTARGTGFLIDGDAALTRSGADAPAVRSGTSWWLRDRASGATLEIGPSFLRDAGDPIVAAPSPGALTLTRSRAGLALETTVWVDPASRVEWRRLRVTNTTAHEGAIELTGCAEVVLQSADADAAHPVFSKLFVQTSWSAEDSALFAHRRARDAGARHPELAFALDGPGSIEWETDRARFRGRGGRVPRALASGRALSGTTGNVLDPVLALRRVAVIAPGETLTWHARLASGDDRAALAATLAAGRAPGAVERSRDGASAAEGERRRGAGLDDATADAAHDWFIALATRDSTLRPAPPEFETCARIGDLFAQLGATPRDWLVVAEGAAAADRTSEPRRVVRYGRALGLPLHLVVLVDAAAAHEQEPEPGVSVCARASLAPERLAALRLLARAGLDATLPRLTTRDDDAHEAAPLEIPGPAHDLAAESTALAAAVANSGELTGWNGVGGFSADGREYVITFPRDDAGELVLPPQPWTNVIATPEFGTLVSETGAGFTWSGNSREHRLTPWSNDPLADPHGEALYVQDESTGRWWSPQPGPAPAGRPAVYTARHRAGATTWTLETPELSHRTTVFVDPDLALRCARVEIENRGTATRALRVVAFARLVLGGTAGAPGPLTECDAAAGAVFARNPLDPDFSGRVAWASVAAPADTRIAVGNDARAFLGAEEDVARPAALESGAPPAVASRRDADPAAIVSASFTIEPGGTHVCTFLLGESADRAEALHHLDSLRHPGMPDAAEARAEAGWTALRDALVIRTPEPALDLLVNGWLNYQNLSCRVWGRSAFYQSGGAFGFRDQLQDSAALVWVRPDLCREQILLHARHQFVEGDVLHWWHPPRSRGIRTRFADDLLWLPFLAAFYARTTGDEAVFDEVEPFVTARALAPHEHEAFLEPQRAEESATVYEHAARAIDRSLATGEHGLPLFGCGDWNDGMNRVGAAGKGESVWMAFFLHAVIGAFAPFAERRGDAARLARWRAHQRALEAALETAGWDGEWYRRGYYDDGTPLGTKDGDECRIDALVQAWSVLSGAAPRARAEEAMRSLERHLLDREHGLLRLLAPPFEHTPHDPGYIKGYVPGVRENGGQYTHAALWAVQAMAKLGWRDRAAATLAALSPVSHTSSPEAVARYQVEPYVIAADVYGAPPHVGRGGWTWYTGSAGWMFRVAVESIFGLSVEDGTLRVAPCLPDGWHECELAWRVPASGTRIRIRYVSPSGHAGHVLAAALDGAPVTIAGGAAVMPLPRDGGEHELEITLG